MSNVSMIDGHIDREERKFTDKEIIKALECCKNDFSMSSCLDCPYNKEKSAKCITFMIEDALALILRQQAEIEEWKRVVETWQELHEKDKAKIEVLVEDTFCLRDTLEENERLRAEIERLSNSAKQWEETAKDLLLSKEKAKAEAIKEFADEIHEEICKALGNNYKVRNQRIERNLTDKLAETCDVFVQYVEGKIDALRGIDGFVCDYVKEMVGEDK